MRGSLHTELVACMCFPPVSTWGVWGFWYLASGFRVQGIFPALQQLSGQRKGLLLLQSWSGLGAVCTLTFHFPPSSPAGSHLHPLKMSLLGSATPGQSQRVLTLGALLCLWAFQPQVFHHLPSCQTGGKAPDLTLYIFNRRSLKINWDPFSGAWGAW